MTTPMPSSPSSESAWPLWGLYMELPHPHASKEVNPPPVLMESPSKDLTELMQDPLSIVRFSFPEFNDKDPPPVASLPLNRYDVKTMKGFQHHTFSLQLSNGERVQGHVRRILPCNSGNRVDVGRRGVRALVLLTRTMGGDTVFAAMLKTIEGIMALQAAQRAPDAKQIEIFLYTCFQHHQYMCQSYQQQPEESRKPMIMSIECMEISRSPLWKQVDTNRFLIPVSLLQRSHFSTSNSPILPLLRCLGITNAMRLVSGLLSECRIILVSSSVTRLATCCRSVLSILSQGLLNWQHFLVPVLPLHLTQYLQAPCPYLIGILSQSVDLSRIREMGEILMINLDRNELETRNIPPHLINSRIPDLFSGRNDMDSALSASDALAQDLVEILRSDKKTIFGEISFAGEQAAKAAKAVKSAFGKLRSQGRKFLAGVNDEPVNKAEEDSQDQVAHAVTDEEIYAEGCKNETGEESVRTAFCTFFLSLFGDLKWYLSPSTVPGEIPKLDRDRFIQQKRQLGEGEGSPISPLLKNLCQSQMFEQFVNARIEEIRTRTVIYKDSPLFLVCCNYHRQNNIDFSVMNVRRVAQQMAQANPSRLISQANANARQIAMALTSNKGYEGDHAQGVAQLVEYCRETSVLMDVMSVIWIRLNDSKGVQWRHALYSLQVIRNLLFHGPLAVIAEVTDGIEKIRQMKSYKDNMRAQICLTVQTSATEVFNLLVDRNKLFEIRRFCANRRREIRDKVNPNYQRDSHLSLRLSFKSLHPYLHPQNNRQVAPANIPFVASLRRPQGSMPPQARAQSSRSMPLQQTQQQANIQVAAQGVVNAPQTRAPVVDLLDSMEPQHNTPIQRQHQQAQQDINDIFGNLHLGHPPPTVMHTPPHPPVAHFLQQPTGVHVPPHPTVVHLPPQPTVAMLPPQPAIVQVPVSQPMAGQHAFPANPSQGLTPSGQGAFYNQHYSNPMPPPPAGHVIHGLSPNVHVAAPGQNFPANTHPSQTLGYPGYPPQQPSQNYGAAPNTHPQALQQQRSHVAQFDPFA